MCTATSSRSESGRKGLSGSSMGCRPLTIKGGWSAKMERSNSHFSLMMMTVAIGSEGIASFVRGREGWWRDKGRRMSSYPKLNGYVDRVESVSG